MNKSKKTSIRKKRVSARVKKLSSRPRLHVYRSSKHIYAQIIDNVSGKILAAASDKEVVASKDDTKSSKSAQVGTIIATKAKKAKITKVVFDRGSHKYHGRVKQLAQAARKEGLQF